MTLQADAPASEARPAVAGAAPMPPHHGVQLVHLGMRRTWWVVLCLLLLVVVDLIPTVGPYLALAVLMWMVSGLARAKPRTEPVARRRRTTQPGRSARSDQGAVLPSA